MKKTIPFILIILLIFLTCKEKEPTAPEDETPKSEILAEATIGIEGGTIETEDFKLTIPNGAFSNTSTIKIMRRKKIIFLQIQLPNSLEVENGLPENYILPLQLKIKYFQLASWIKFYCCQENNRNGIN